MSHKLEQAARRLDPVQHSLSALAAAGGVIAGIGLGIVLVGGTVATGGALLAVLGTAAATSGVFGWIGSQFEGQCDPIISGARTVFVGLNKQPAARVTDEVLCHNQPIVSGCRTIFIERLNATRASEETRCDGTIKEDSCCPNVFYGGPSVQVMAKRVSGELSPVFFWAREIVGIVNWGRGGYTLVTTFSTINWFQRLQGIAKFGKGLYSRINLARRLFGNEGVERPREHEVRVVSPIPYGMRPANYVEVNPPLVPIEGVAPARPPLLIQQPANALPAPRPPLLAAGSNPAGNPLLQPRQPNLMTPPGWGGGP